MTCLTTSMTQSDPSKSGAKSRRPLGKRPAADAPAQTSSFGCDNSNLQAIGSTEGDAFLAEWAIGGTGPLMARVRREHQAVEPLINPATRQELAQLVDHFWDRPLPIELRAVLLNELCGRRKRKTGPKSAATTFEQMQDLLLLPIYETGIERGEKLREWLLKRSTTQKRNATQYDIPTCQRVACHHVKKWLPKFGDMEDGSLANSVTKRRNRERALQDRPAVARLRALIELLEQTG